MPVHGARVPDIRCLKKHVSALVLGGAGRLARPHQVRQALTMDAQRTVEDLVVLLRRRWNN